MCSVRALSPCARTLCAALRPIATLNFLAKIGQIQNVFERYYMLKFKKKVNLLKEKNLRFYFKIFGSVFRPRFSPVSVRFKKFGLNRISVFLAKIPGSNRTGRFGSVF